MTIPLVFQAKAICIRLLLIAFSISFVFIILLSYNNIGNFHKSPKNRDLKLGCEFEDPVTICVFDASDRPDIDGKDEGALGDKVGVTQKKMNESWRLEAHLTY
ncbi:hypothetical protein ACP275_04G202100 [Erythranthe tilingii]